MPRMVGYGFNPPEKLIGGRGEYYTYVLAGNGVFIEAKNDFLNARICIATCQVRGLEPLEEKVELVNGPAPRSLYDLGFSTFLVRPLKERYLAITWNAGYHLEYPPQEGTAGGVTYGVTAGAIVDIHSHGDMGAFFSTTDDRDEQGFQLYMVVGKVDTRPEYRLRIGIYGYFAELNFEEVFACPTTWTAPSPATARTTPVSSLERAALAATSRKDSPGFFHRLFRSYL